MNKTHTYLLAAVVGLASCLTGCIKEDFSDCPPEEVIPPDPTPEANGSLTLQLSYRMHTTQENGAYVDLFNDEVRKVDVFVFDEKGEYVQTVERVAEPLFAENYETTLTLPEGSYQFVVWGNHYHDETNHSDPDTRNLEACRMWLTAAHEGETELLTDSLFYGNEIEPVTVKASEETVVPIGLMKVRDDVRVLVRWREKGTDGYCDVPAHFSNVSARIVTYTYAGDFYNEPYLRGDSLILLPGDLQPAERYDSAFYAGKTAPDKATSYKADFAVMRLTPQTEDYLQLFQGDSLVYERPIMDFLSRVEEYRTQEGLDREDAYLIELLFACEHPGEGPDDPDPDEPGGGDEPDNSGGGDHPGGGDNPGGGGDPDYPDYPDPEPEWGALISFKVNGWNFIDREIDI